MKELWERWVGYLSKPVLGNHVGVWALAVLAGILAFIAIRITVRSIARRLAARAEKGGNKVLGFLAEVVGRTSILTIFLASVVVATQFLQLPGNLAGLLRSMLI